MPLLGRTLFLRTHLSRGQQSMALLHLAPLFLQTVGRPGTLITIWLLLREVTPWIWSISPARIEPSVVVREDRGLKTI